ncbi:Prepilin-type cleavage/methylation domain-containing protein [Desulfonema limicola]|uniref:Prepilin-type cleavage/methylation domain-containing protein n=1 Tax=Desulfonema limicola TaxID=45656 RepID=A0A975GFK5_9BACT|nr:type II secretion system protein [Desulfonema limicola]QTA79333.1 Prepilin-type cleavage/methylation domain-containing protein [Desulfonema limicola]
MKQKHTDFKGFTLLEVVITLILMSIIGSLSGLGLIQIVDGFLLSKYNTETAQKSQMAMTRLIKEIQSIEYIFTDEPPTQTFIKYLRDDGTADFHKISFSAGEITIDNNILINSVNDFNMTYYEKFDQVTADGNFSPSATMIELKLKLDSGSGISSEFKTFVFLRGLI